MILPSFDLAALNEPSLLEFDWVFAASKMLMLALLAPPLVLGLLWSSIRITRNQYMVVDRNMIGTIAGARWRWNVVSKSICALMIVVFLSLAAAGPQTDPQEVETITHGRDVVFLVDVSRSMLARDVAPNRLEKAKLWINDLVDELGNDRVGLIAFSGSSSVLSPLTTDRLFFKLTLEELSPDSVRVGGTNIGDAIRKAMGMVFVNNDHDTYNNFRDLVLISDGEDQESLPIEAARLAGQAGVRIIAIGIGSDQGASVPLKQDKPASGRNEVRSKLESGTLRAIAAASPGGVYLEVGTGTIDMGKVYRDLVSSAEQRSIGITSQLEYTQKYMLFVAAGLIFILIDMMIPLDARRKLT